MKRKSFEDQYQRGDRNIIKVTDLQIVKVIKTVGPACNTTKHLLVGTSCNPKKFSELYQTTVAKGENSQLPKQERVESERGREADWRRRIQEKERSLNKKAERKQITEATYMKAQQRKQKVIQKHKKQMI